MENKTSEFDFIESVIILFAVVGFGYTLYSFLSFAWDNLSGVQITVAIFGWIFLWQIIATVLIFGYRFCTGQLVILQKLGHLLSKPTK